MQKGQHLGMFHQSLRVHKTNFDAQLKRDDHGGSVAVLMSLMVEPEQMCTYTRQHNHISFNTSLPHRYNNVLTGDHRFSVNEYAWKELTRWLPSYPPDEKPDTLANFSQSPPNDVNETYQKHT